VFRSIVRRDPGQGYPGSAAKPRGKPHDPYKRFRARHKRRRAQAARSSSVELIAASQAAARNAASNIAGCGLRNPTSREVDSIDAIRDAEVAKVTPVLAGSSDLNVAYDDAP